jgi:YD repeat-containing protein
MGRVTRQIEKWTAGGSSQYRTNHFVYDSNGFDLLRHHLGPTVTTNNLLVGYGGYAYHQPARMTNAAYEVTHYTYDASRRLQTVLHPSGLLITNSYYPSGHGDAHQRNRLEHRIERWTTFGSTTVSSTNSFTWLNGLLRSQHDPRGAASTNSWDSLGRLSRIDYPDSTYELFAYTNGAGTKLLDRTYHRDRLGHVQTWEYDGNRRVIRHTDPVGSVTAHEYCDCGTQPTRIVHAYGTGIAQTNAFSYNFQGRLLVHTLPEGSSTTNTYDSIGRLRVVSDVFGRTTNHLDNLGRLLSVSNTVGRLLARTYDHEDRPVITTDSNGISITNTYDAWPHLPSRRHLSPSTSGSWSGSVSESVSNGR